MEISIDFTKDGEGKVWVRLKVEKSEDYPTMNIFNAYHDYPTNHAFMLANSELCYVEKACRDYDDAVTWAGRQVDALRAHIIKWRNVKVPTAYTVKL